MIRHFSYETTNVIHEEATSGGVVTFTNNTENTIGSNATFGATMYIIKVRNN